MAFKGAIVDGNYVANPLSDALSRMGLSQAGDELRTKMVEYTTDEAYEIAKATAPVLSGTMKASITKRVENSGYLIRGIVAIPATIKYRFAVLFGDKRHPVANRFMDKALDRAVEKLHLNFHKIAQEAFDESRGK